MKTIIKLIDRLSAIGGALCAVMLCAGLGLIFVEIILRGAFSSTLFITEEYSGYLMSAMTFCGLAYTMRERGHIRVSLVHGAISKKTRLYLDMACFVVGVIFCMSLTYFTALLFWDSVVTQSRSMQISETYLAIPQFFLPFGTLLLTLQLLAELLKSYLVLKGDTEGLVLHQEAEDLGR